MRSILLATAFFLSAIAAKAQLTVFTVEHNGTTSIFTHLDSAIANAQSGDFIYLPGGIINFSGNISKSITLVGAGFFPDSTAATSQTIIVPTVRLLRGANNFSISGVFLQNSMTVDSCNSVSISRCRIGTNKDAVLGITKCQNILINGCILGSVENIIPSSPNLVLQNCIIYGHLYGDGLTIKNCILFEPASTSHSQLFNYGNTAFTRLDNSYFENNIIYSVYVFNPSTGTTFNYFYNNVFANISSLSNGISSNNKFNNTITSVLSFPINTSTYNPSDKFNLPSGSPAIGAGVAGTDCGIYGGTTPFKAGAVPFNPRIKSANIPSVTNPQGNLDVQFDVIAQPN